MKSSKAPKPAHSQHDKDLISQCLSLLRSPVQFNSPYLLKFWKWTGFGEKKLLDYLQLLCLPIFLSVGGIFFQHQFNEYQQELTDIRKEQDQYIATNRYQQEMLSKYFDQMEKLLLNQNLRKSRQGSEVRVIARARTLSTLRELDGERKGQLLIFLAEANLIARNQVVVDLRGAYLSHANLSRADLSGTDLSSTNLFNANLVDTNLSNTNLSGTNLTCATLRDANLQGANLKRGSLPSFLSTKQIKAAKNWQQATYNAGFYKELLNLSPEAPVVTGHILLSKEEVCENVNSHKEEL